MSKYEQRPYEIGRGKIIDALIPSGEGRCAVDIGCGPGFFCGLLSAKGWSTTAIDRNSENLREARPRATTLHCGDALEILSELPADYFDLALALEIIEHFPRSEGERLLSSVSRILKRGGHLLLSTPNRYSTIGLKGYYWQEKLLGGEKWNAWDVTHKHIYSSLEIRRLLREYGFEPESETGYWYEMALPFVGRFHFIRHADFFPVNLFGFNLILYCTKR
jgi:2-polyprenyl-3-methyl-5-hydroxy-6-metoxy-1,4-benzoquinol methylase